MNYTVKIERKGDFVIVGEISETGFKYADSYLSAPNSTPLSISLPLRDTCFSIDATKCYFDGLLPEGFSRKSVAEWMHVSEEDYLSILAGLGKECLGAVLVTDDEEQPQASYRELSLDEVKALAAEGATQSSKIVTESHLSLTGASGKVGLYYEPGSGKWFQPYGTAPSTHIIKQSHVRLNDIVVNELLCLKTAKRCGIDVPECFIIDVDGKDDGHILFATERYDRSYDGAKNHINGLPVPLRLHQEDFAQAMGIPSAYKYEPENENYLKGMFDTILHWSVNPLEDRLKLWDMIVFNILIGNTDSHIKNFSLLYDSEFAGIRLAPAYDMISTTAYERCTRKLSMHIAEAKTIDEVNLDAFSKAAREISLGEKMAMKRLGNLVGNFEQALTQTTKELSDKGFSSATILQDRILKSSGLPMLK